MDSVDGIVREYWIVKAYCRGMLMTDVKLSTNSQKDDVAKIVIWEKGIQFKAN